MDSDAHALFGLLLLGLWPVLGKYIWISVLAAILCDLDSLYLIYKRKAFSLKKIRYLLKNVHESYQKNPKTAHIDVFYLFHTLEFNIILLILAHWWPVLGFISLGFLFHTLLDIVHHRDLRMPVLRWLFFLEFLRILLKYKK